MGVRKKKPHLGQNKTTVTEKWQISFKKNRELRGVYIYIKNRVNAF